MIYPKISKIVVAVIALSLATSCNSNVQTAPLKTHSSAASVGSAKRIVALTSLSADIVGILDPTKLVGISDSRLFDQKTEFKNLP